MDRKIIEPEITVKTSGRADILSYFPDNSVCAEFGVYSGKFTSKILTKHSPKKLYLVDPYWRMYGEEFYWNKQKTWDTFCSAVKRVKKYDKYNNAIFIIDTDLNFLNGIKDNFFDWIYIDSTHEYEDTLKELEAIKSKIKSEGLICGHDYRDNPNHKHYGVCRAITHWLEKNKNYKLYLRDNHSQWIIKKY